MNRVFAWVTVRHAKALWPRSKHGIVDPAHYYCVASAEMMLPATPEKGIDAQRFCAMAYRITQNTAEGWETCPAWNGFMAFGLQEVRSTRVGDIIVVRLSDTGVEYGPEEWFEMQLMGEALKVVPLAFNSFGTITGRISSQGANLSEVRRGDPVYNVKLTTSIQADAEREI